MGLRRLGEADFHRNAPRSEISFDRNPDTPVTPALQRLARLVEPPPRLRISEWADAHAYLPAEGNAEPGKYRVDRMPYQKAMLDDPLDPNVVEIVWMIASQLGKTLCIILILEYFIDHQPTKILVVYPKLDDAKDWMRDKFIPATRDTPRLDGKLKEPRARDSESRALNRKFPGGGIVAVGSISTSSLRRVSARVIIQDEIDDFETTPQGDSMALADKRADTFHNAVKLKSSTPTTTDLSRIEAKYKESDQQRYFVPCCKCGHLQHLRWSQFKFSFTAAEYKKAGGDPRKVAEDSIRDTARAVYVCEDEKCGHYWTDAQRIASINDPRAGWRATAPFNRIRGRHLNGLYRTIGRKDAYQSYHQEFAEEFLKAKHGGRELLRVWTNTFLSETFAEEFTQLAWNPLMTRAEDYGPDLPLEIMLLTAGSDVHPDRIEIGVIGWGDGEESWWMEKIVVWGDFDLPECQERVNEVLLRKWKHPILGPMPITCCGLDIGHQTKLKSGYRFCKLHRARKIWAVKGSPVPNAPIYTAAQEKRFGIWRYNIGTDTAKSTIFDRLAIEEPGPRYIHFPKHRVNYTGADGKPAVHLTAFNEKFFKQLCSEKRQRSFERGLFKQKWVQTQERNEDLDIAVYNLAAFEILNPVGYIARQWAKVQELERTAIAPMPDATPPAVDYTLDRDKKYQPDQKPPGPAVPVLKLAPVAAALVPRRRIKIGGTFIGHTGKKWI